MVTPAFSLSGGVVEFCKMHLEYSSHKIHKFEMQSGLKTGKFSKLIFSLLDYARFVFCLLFIKVDVVHVNPSLGSNSVQRDGIYVKLAKLFRKKVYAHWHGWNPSNEHLLNSPKIKNIFLADHIKFLSATFESKFIQAGYNGKTSLGNTFVDDRLLNDWRPENYCRANDTILFLSTVSENKGIYIALEAYGLLLKKHPHLKMIVAGVGPELKNATKKAKDLQYNNVEFVGFVQASKKAELYSKSGIYIFPSFYEGMPTSVLEAMAFGLPVVGSNVGALEELFHKAHWGIKIPQHDAKLYAESIDLLLCDEKVYNQFSSSNINTGKNYLATSSVNRIDEDYRSLFL